MVTKPNLLGRRGLSRFLIVFVAASLFCACGEEEKKKKSNNNHNNTTVANQTAGTQNGTNTQIPATSQQPGAFAGVQTTSTATSTSTQTTTTTTTGNGSPLSLLSPDTFNCLLTSLQKNGGAAYIPQLTGAAANGTNPMAFLATLPTTVTKGMSTEPKCAGFIAALKASGQLTNGTQIPGITP